MNLTFRSLGEFEPFDEDEEDDDGVAYEEPEEQMGNEFSRSVGPSLIPLSVDSVSDQLSLRLKRKIWSNEYVNLTSLLKRNVYKETSFLYINDGGQIESKSAESKDNFFSIDHWADCFLYS